VEDIEETVALVGVSVNQFIVQASAEKARAIIDSFWILSRASKSE
jgi:uncharacterized protein (DUF1778 family)